jgi:uncharacterized protein with FMN-binding domain
MWKYILGGFGLIVAFGVFFMFNGMGAIKNMDIYSVDLTGVGDGTYTGAFKKGRWNSQVEVTVKDHKIVDIKVLNADPTVNSISEDTVKKVIEAQKVDIDIVSGATVTTKALLKAIEDALTK